jgi:hypothetical protein
MVLSHRLRLIGLLIASLLVSSRLAAQSCNITDFANDFSLPAASPTWFFPPVNSATSLLSGTNSNGNSIASGFDPQPTSCLPG